MKTCSVGIAQSHSRILFSENDLDQSMPFLDARWSNRFDGTSAVLRNHCCSLTPFETVGALTHRSRAVQWVLLPTLNHVSAMFCIDLLARQSCQMNRHWMTRTCSPQVPRGLSRKRNKSTRGRLTVCVAPRVWEKVQPVSTRGTRKEGRIAWHRSSRRKQGGSGLLACRT